MLSEAVIVFANLPASPALAEHKFMLDLRQSQPRSIEQRTEKNARLTAKSNAVAATRADPDRSKMPIKAAV
jgi:hypothetical protein